MHKKVLICLSTNCKGAEIKLLNGITAIRVLDTSLSYGIPFYCSNFLLSCAGNANEFSIEAWFEAEFNGSLPRIGIKCRSWNQTTASFQWPNSSSIFVQYKAGPGGILDSEPYKEFDVYF